MQTLLRPQNEIRLVLPRLHAKQLEIKRGARRFNTVACGRRFGKSTLGLDLAVEPSLQGHPVGWFAPNYKYLVEAWNTLDRYLYPVKARSDKNEKRIELITGGLIEFWTLEDEDAGRSRKYKRVIVDEAGLVAKLGKIWQEAIRPTLADLHGDASLMGTPKGRNFFWECYQRGLDPLRPEWQSWQMPTTANPFIDPLEVEAARLELPERVFQQEYLAAFLEDGGGVFRGVRGAATAQPQPRAIPGHSYVIGCDWGRENDYSVLAVVDTTLKSCVAIERSNKVEYQMQIARLQGLCERFNPDAVYPEENSIGAPIIEQLRRILKNSKGQSINVRPFQTTNASKQMIIDALQLAFEQHSITIINDEVMVGELEAYEMERTKSGLIRYGAPEGMHDDTVMALALSWHGAVNSSSSFNLSYSI